jgi:hypothetical protein
VLFASISEKSQAIQGKQNAACMLEHSNMELGGVLTIGGCIVPAIRHALHITAAAIQPLLRKCSLGDIQCRPDL